MSHPQPKRASAAELIELHSKARVKYATPVHPLLAGSQHELSNADARAQVARLR